MTKLVSLLGLLVVLSLGAIAWIGLPATDGIAGQGQAASISACAPAEVAVDEGYGITRHIARPCPQR